MAPSSKIKQTKFLSGPVRECFSLKIPQSYSTYEQGSNHATEIYVPYDQLTWWMVGDLLSYKGDRVVFRVRTRASLNEPLEIICRVHTIQSHWSTICKLNNDKQTQYSVQGNHTESIQCAKQSFVGSCMAIENYQAGPFRWKGR